MDSIIIAADIGGTSSRFACFRQSEQLTLEKSLWLDTANFLTFKGLLEAAYYSKLKSSFENAAAIVVAIAGPVVDNRYCSPPNIAWDVDVKRDSLPGLTKHFFIINDFLAQAVSCLSSVGKSAKEVLPGTPQSGAAIAVIGAGTGLGKAVIVSGSDGRFYPSPAEGGKASFPCESEEEFEFFKFVLSKTEGRYVCWEDVVSGVGLSRVHEFLTKEKLSAADVAARFAEFPLTLEWFSRFYGRACRNYVLEVLALGGLFIAGGIAAKNPVILKHEAFQAAFRYARDHSALIEKVPVRLIDNEESGLWGAAHYGLIQRSSTAGKAS